MGTLKIPPPDTLADQGRLRLRELLLAGAASKATSAVDDSYFNGHKSRVGHAKSTEQSSDQSLLERRRFLE